MGVIENIFLPPPPPPTELGKYRVLSSTAGVRVSPLAIGGASIGEAWNEVMGTMSREQSFKLLDAFEEAGGNFIDTANNYQDGQSEKWIGEWMKERGNRDQMVVATKFTSHYKVSTIGKQKGINFCGNHKKSLHMSVRDSLVKLQTDYIDILYIHWWDWTTSIEELMDSLHILVQQGKVLYLGASDLPAWVVSAANTYAKLNSKTQFCVYQGEWNIMLRDFEREIIPMARHFGMALAPWNVLAGGRLQSKKALEQRKKDGEGLRAVLGDKFSLSEQELKFSEALETVAQEHGIESVTAVALAYVMQKTTGVFPIIGGRKVEHLKDNIQALSLHLTDKQIEFLESQKEFEPGFPMNSVGPDPHVTGKGSVALVATGPLAFQLYPKPIGHE